MIAPPSWIFGFTLIEREWTHVIHLCLRLVSGQFFIRLFDHLWSGSSKFNNQIYEVHVYVPVGSVNPLRPSRPSSGPRVLVWVSHLVVDSRRRGDQSGTERRHAVFQHLLSHKRNPSADVLRGLREVDAISSWRRSTVKPSLSYWEHWLIKLGVFRKLWKKLNEHQFWHLSPLFWIELRAKRVIICSLEPVMWGKKNIQKL